MKLTVSEGLTTLKTLKDRHRELVGLRDANATSETRYYGANADKSTERKPVYDVKALDKLVSSVAKEIRLLETEIKRSNVRTQLEYEWDDNKLGEVS